MPLEDCGSDGGAPLAYRTPDEYISGLFVDRDFLVQLEDPVQRRALMLALSLKAWVDLDDLYTTLAQLIAYDPSWLQDIYDLLPVSDRLWPLVQSFDTSTLFRLAEFPAPLFAPVEAPSWMEFLSRVLGLLEVRREAALSPELALFRQRVGECVN